jgi:DNA repair protein RadC
VTVLKNLPAALRPREKLLANGASALVDTELLALLLGTGYKGHSVLQLAEHLLKAFNGLNGLLQAPSHELQRIKGLGPAKQAQLGAVLELARRSLTQALMQKTVFSCIDTLKNYVSLHLAHLSCEVFGVLFLDAQNHLLTFEKMFQGSLTQTSVYPREIIKRALDLGAASVVLAHNHPSGAAKPSSEDLRLTQQLQTALNLVDIGVLDHLIVGKNQVVSLAEQGVL